MNNLKETIETIEHCINNGKCSECKLHIDRKCDAITSCRTLLKDALELLKEREEKIASAQNL